MKPSAGLGALASSSCLPNPSPEKCLSEIASLNSHLWEAHHIEDSVQLVMVIRVAGLYILLPENFNN